MMSDNLAKLGHFNAAHDICTSLLAQGRDYMDEGTRTAFETNAVLFGLQSQWPRMGISDADTNYDIPSTSRTNKSSSLLSAAHNVSAQCLIPEGK